MVQVLKLDINKKPEYKVSETCSFIVASVRFGVEIHSDKANKSWLVTKTWEYNKGFLFPTTNVEAKLSKFTLF